MRHVRRSHIIPVTSVVLVLFLALVRGAESVSCAIVLHDVTAETGITFRHTDGGCGRRYIMETVSAGLALFDYDNDGDIDIYFLNGAPLRGARFEKPPRNALYRNDGGWRFTDVTDEAGVGDTGYGLGVAIGDYDNDGDQDIYLNNYGPNVLYRNNGDGTFTDVTEAAGVGNGNRVGAGVCFLDIDKDGDLDLYVANYLKFSYDRHVETSTRGYPVYANPGLYPADPDTLYRNNGDGTFTDISVESGVAAHAGWGMGIVSADFDNDGDTDVFIGNDVAENFLFQNDGTGKFEETGLLAGTAYDLHGDEQGSMGVDCGDFDNDGLLDFYVTSYQNQLATLYRNCGEGVFEDVTALTGAPNLFEFKGKGPLETPLKVAYAREGATIINAYEPGNKPVKLKRKKIRGFVLKTIIVGFIELMILMWLAGSFSVSMSAIFIPWFIGAFILIIYIIVRFVVKGLLLKPKKKETVPASDIPRPPQQPAE